jgi:glycosyltransferase involved in cell wall biosynthesis
VRVAVDGRSLRTAADQRGVTRYLAALLEAMARAFPDDRYAVLVPGEPGEAARPAIGQPAVELRRPRLAAAPLLPSAATLGRPRLDRLAGGCDVAFVPAVAPVAVSPNVPLVVTVHDLSFEHRRSDYGTYSRLWHRAARPRRLARRAARVIAVSEAVRGELVSEWGLPPDKVVAVRSGPGGGPRDPEPPPRDLPETYVLAVGALEPRKLPEETVRAHARARDAGLAAGLVFAGDGPLRERLDGAGATVLGRVSDGVLETLYRGAMAVVCASREEGFGFTPLEALRRGVPAIVSDLPVFRETVPAGALRVPAGDVDALADALLRLEREPELRRRLVDEGRRALDGLSWEAAATRTREVLREACAT